MVSGLLSLSTTRQVAPLALRHGDPCKECRLSEVAARKLPNYALLARNRHAVPTERCLLLGAEQKTSARMTISHFGPSAEVAPCC
jgi:hypothetical protein